MAPFIKNLSEERIREGIRLFISNLNQPLSNRSLVGSSLGIEFVIPGFLKEKEAIGPGGKIVGFYKDFVEESRRFASLLLEVMLKDDTNKPIFNPHLIMKLRPQVFEDSECEDLLLMSHNLAAKTGLPYFANLCLTEQTNASYNSTGFRLDSGWRGDWELDTLQTGSIDSVIINLPRIMYEARGKENNFFQILDDQLEMALRALEIKYRTIKQRQRERMLPFLMQKVDGDQYFRIKNAIRLVSFVGLNETIKAFFNKPLKQDGETLDFAMKIVSSLSSEIMNYSKKPETRASLGMLAAAEASKRLAELDAEKYGWAKVRAQGTREQPFYTGLVALPLGVNISWSERLGVEEKFHSLTPGGHLAVLPLEDEVQKPDDLLIITKNIVKTMKVGLYVFNKNIGYCASCQQIFYGSLVKCPSCGSVNMLHSFSRI